MTGKIVTPKIKLINGVLGLAVRKDGKFLLSLRNEPKYPSVHKKWQVPGGGIEHHESAEQALIRECQEELGVTPKILFPYPVVRKQVFNRPGRTVHVWLMCYPIDIGSQKIVVDGDETLDYGWYTYNEAKALSSLPLTMDFIDETQRILIQYSLFSMLE